MQLVGKQLFKIKYRDKAEFWSAQCRVALTLAGRFSPKAPFECMTW